MIPTARTGRVNANDEPQKYLFLDMDGVVCINGALMFLVCPQTRCTYASMLGLQLWHGPSRPIWRVGVLKAELLVRLQAVVKATGCHVVLSSNCRRLHAHRRVANECLKHYGIKLHGHTPVMQPDNQRPVDIMACV